MVKHWYVKTESAERGPIPYRELVELAKRGAIGKSDLVRSTWHKDWQPADSLLHDHLPAVTEPKHDPWSEAIHDAMAKSRHVVREPARREWRSPVSFGSVSLGWVGTLFGFLFGWTGGLRTGIGNSIATPIVWLLDWFEAARDSIFVRYGFRFLFAGVAAGITVVAIERWGVHQALSTPSHGPPWDKPFHGRRFPLIGDCTKGEYLFLLTDAAGAAAVVAWFAAGWFERGEGE